MSIGWMVFVAMILWSVFYVTTSYRATPVPVSIHSVRRRMLESVSGGVSRIAPRWRQDDLSALRTRVNAQFR